MALKEQKYTKNVCFFIKANKNNAKPCCTESKPKNPFSTSCRSAAIQDSYGHSKVVLPPRIQWYHEELFLLPSITILEVYIQQ